jgi:hypothetical protein
MIWDQCYDNYFRRFLPTSAKKIGGFFKKKHDAVIQFLQQNSSTLILKTPVYLPYVVILKNITSAPGSIPCFQL